MTRLHVTKSSFLPRLLPALAGLLAAGRAQADETCTLRGEPVMSQGISIYDAPSGGSELAHFTGAKVGLTVTAFPESSGGRARVETTGFRIKGFVRSRDLPVYTARSVPVYAGHVWIAEGRRVSIIGGAPGKLHAEKNVTSPFTGYFHGWAPCDAFTLSPRVPPGWTPQGGERGHVLKRDRLDLYAEAQGTVVTTVERAGDGPGVLFWSSDRSGAWLHVEHHGDILLDGWARASDLSSLPPGEMMDQLVPSITQPGTPQLSLQGTPKTVRVAQDVALRGAASDAALVIGGIDSGVEVMVLDVVAGWASVVPKSLAVMAGAGQFWARAKDLGM